MLKQLLLPTALAPALLLGGCMGTENRGLESIHQPVVSRQDFAFDVATAGNGLAAGEQARLDGWLASMRLSYGDRVSIDDPANWRAVHEQVARSVARYGLLLTDDRPVTGAPIPTGAVRVVVSRMHASVPGCPDWSRDSSVEYDQNTSSNYGCASNASLAAMIANPEDLVHGRGAADGSDPVRSAKAIDAFRKAAPSGGGGATVSSAGGTR